MRRLWWVLGVLTVAACALAQGEQGGFGGGGFGGAQGGGQGQGQGQDGDTEPRQVGPYLSHRETASILTPGEYVEWELELEKGQLVIAEARSEAFDPALEIVEGDKVLIDNDDRFPGDQRPLLIWHCDKEGKYLLRARSFRGRAGGQMLSRHAVYDCVTLALGSTEHARSSASHQVYRVRLKAGEFVQARFQLGPAHFIPFNMARISPIGLPHVDIVAGLSSATPGTLLAPVDGDYYFWTEQARVPATADNAPVKIMLETIVVEPVRSIPSDVTHPQSQLGVWVITLKAGDFVEVATDFDSPGREVMFEEAPDLKRYSLSEPGKNPFLRRMVDKEEPVAYWEKDTRGIGRGSRGLLAFRDTTIWIATRANNLVPGRMKIRVTPAAREMGASGADGRMALNHVQYWAFNANPGEVITFRANVQGFAAQFQVMGPRSEGLTGGYTDRDPGRSEMFIVARTKGRHFVSVACRGHGGTGTYAIERSVVAPTELVAGKSIEGTLAEGEVKVIRFTLDPSGVKLLKSYLWGLERRITNLAGEQANMQFFRVDSYEYGHSPVQKPTEFLLVLSGRGGKFSLALVDPP